MDSYLIHLTEQGLHEVQAFWNPAVTFFAKAEMEGGDDNGYQAAELNQPAMSEEIVSQIESKPSIYMSRHRILTDPNHEYFQGYKMRVREGFANRFIYSWHEQRSRLNKK